MATAHARARWAVVGLLVFGAMACRQSAKSNGNGNGVHPAIAQGKTCVDCHRARFDASKTPNHLQQGFGHKCEACHTLTAWKPSKPFNHAKFPEGGGWPLEGKHGTMLCTGCHTDPAKTPPVACEACHKAEYDATVAPAHEATGIPTTCATCHKASGWKPASFDHDQHWPLTGKHEAAKCTACHVDPKVVPPKDCAGCHMAQYQASTTPNHLAQGMPTTCNSCHQTTSWKPASFDHAQHWPLTGKHQAAKCTACHTDPNVAPPKDCAGCHMAQYQASTSPNHQAQGMPTTCGSCHTATAWKPASFDHAKYWPLTGKHQPAKCAACHTDPNVAPPKDCAGCHLAQYKASTSPNHQAQGMPTTCGSCHTATAWKPASFDHAKYWPLLGKHQAAKCTACHIAPNVAPPKTCAGCHMTQYQATTGPNHKAAGMPTTCEACHSAAAWKPASFDHASYWPLTGAHAKVACATCHKDPAVKAQKACATCHLAKYTATTTPNHKTGGIPTTCEACHTTTAWKPATFDHAKYWPLTGAHQTATCAGCHGTSAAAPPKDCAGCHKTRYDQTTAPNHKAAGLPTTCETCHTTAAWKPASFDHAKFWPLTGKHASAACTGCHKAPADHPTKVCLGCHQAKYDASTAPNHKATGMSTACETCHTTAAWQPASFDHATYWPLTGKHATAQCAGCHQTSGDKPTKDCVGCHQVDYTASLNPDHAALGLPTACATCHATTGWTPAKYASHKFPIASGKHAVACAKCHTNPANYASFTCMTSGCHSKSSTDGHHDGESGYSYTAAKCYQCHPSGN